MGIKPRSSLLNILPMHHFTSWHWEFNLIEWINRDPCGLPKTFVPKKVPNDVLRQIFNFLYRRAFCRLTICRLTICQNVVLTTFLAMTDSTEEMDERRFASRASTEGPPAERPVSFRVGKLWVGKLPFRKLLPTQLIFFFLGLRNEIEGWNLPSTSRPRHFAEESSPRFSGQPDNESFG